MNIFAFHTNPVTCARWLDNKRIGTALKEANQMMSLAVKETLPGHVWVDHEGEGMLTKGRSHLNHPVSIWVRASRSNFNWTMCYATALYEEHKLRYGTEHGSYERTKHIREHFGQYFPADQRTPFQNSARHGGHGLDFSHLPIHQAYRTYIIARWKIDKRPPDWPQGQMPEWAMDRDMNMDAVAALRAAGHPIYADS